MLRARTLSLAFLALALLVPEAAAAAPAARIIVKREPGVSAAEQRDVRADAGVRLIEKLRLPRTEVVKARAGEASEALHALNADDAVVYAELDKTRRALGVDQYLKYQWALNNSGQEFPAVDEHGGSTEMRGSPDADMDVLEAWADSTGTGQTVAVVDSGVAAHPDLAGNLGPGYDWVDRDTNATDANGHGTHVAGTIAALSDNDIGTAGVAPDARILPLRVLGTTGSGRVSDIVDAFDFAGDQGVRVVNASLGDTSPSNAEYDAIEAHPDTLFVVAAGNRGADNDVSPEYPCSYDLENIICVGASDADDHVPSFSNFGAGTVDLFAPGSQIFSTYLPTYDFTYAIGSGTSMAAPHVAGEAALLLARDPSLSIAELKARMISSGDAKLAFETISVSGTRANARTAVESIAADRDGDGVMDADDNCPAVPNPDQADSDSDNVGNACEAPAPDSDGDRIADSQDLCPYQDGAPAAQGCPGTAANSDGDARPDMFDNCKTVTNPGQQDGDKDGIGDACDPDWDNDRVANGRDNCALTYNPTQANRDGDHLGDACDSDRDGDGRLNVNDRCPDVRAFTANGCPAPPPPPPLDRDHDGRADASDACPTEPAATKDGCPLPVVAELTPKVRGRTVTVKVVTSRPATVRITIRRKRGGRWLRVTRKALVTSENRVTLRRKLRRGRHRVVVVLSSNAGTAAPATKRFRVR